MMKIIKYLTISLSVSAVTILAVNPVFAGIKSTNLSADINSQQKWDQNEN